MVIYLICRQPTPQMNYFQEEIKNMMGNQADQQLAECAGNPKKLEALYQEVLLHVYGDGGTKGY